MKKIKDFVKKCGNSLHYAKDVVSGNPLYGIDTFFIFNSYLMVKGWVYLLNDELTNVTLDFKGTNLAHATIGLPSEGVKIGHKLGFCIETLVSQGIDREKLTLDFSFAKSKNFTLPYKGIVSTIISQRSNNYDLLNFLDLMKTKNCKSLLEIGSRARSGVVRKELFGEIDYLGIDILPGENVDIVGDAHDVSTLVGSRKFDAVVSMYTFEHIFMPWKVALEMNKVMNIGGVGFIATHQTVGMHDLPWDYWRFSDSAWHALFNEYTGFKVVNTLLCDPMYLVPFIDYGESYNNFEKSAGFYNSIVVFEKIKDSNLSWDVPAKDVAIGAYPE